MNCSEHRIAIDSALEKGAWTDAGGLLGQYFWREASLAAALFTLEKSKRLPRSKSWTTCKLVFCRSFIVEPVIPLLRAAALTYKLDVEVLVGDFNTYAQDILNIQSRIYQFQPQIVVLAVQTRDVAPRLWYDFTQLSASEVEQQIANVLKNYGNWVSTFRARSQAYLIIHTLSTPAFPNAGILDYQMGCSQLEAIQRINDGLKKIVVGTKGVYLLDYAGLEARHGKLLWGDEQKWLTARMPIAATNLIHLAKEYLRYLLPLSGRRAKALVVDLDNILWGGIIGEDGINGIKIGAEYPGAAYLALQRVILDLYSRGVILAVCSKNNPGDAMEVFEKHPSMILRKHHFGAMRINWNDKAHNLREIAVDLNIGIDSLVFLDDNPAERERVRSETPDVFVIDLPDDPMHYAATVRDCPIFECLHLSEEDRQRGKYCAEQQLRRGLQEHAASLEGFYCSLEMVATISAATAATIPRIAQLTQKTNQFNLTTRRYTEQRIQEMANDPEWGVYSISVRDKYGDNGLVSVAITHTLGDFCEIDTFLLSCRVIGRTVETALLAFLAQTARKNGVRILRGAFIPTSKNAPAKDFYEKHHFVKVAEENNGIILELDLIKRRIEFPEWIKIEIKEQEIE